MTDEAGVVTGDLTLSTATEHGSATVKVQYKDADEWYTVTGSKVSLRDAADAEAIHALAVGLLNRPSG
ncbi:hypothetical protein AB0M43_15105 [Longispora sp. NPDC051575]|uniref:hypothetical protein n=1 Tax=Longispora sp. NPDC051575 TaxID=3154943 RepID=UPI00343E236E